MGGFVDGRGGVVWLWAVKGARMMVGLSGLGGAMLSVDTGGGWCFARVGDVAEGFVCLKAPGRMFLSILLMSVMECWGSCWSFCVSTARR